MAYCPAHPPELVILSNILPPIFFYILIVLFYLLPLTTSHLLVTSQPLYPTLFKVNSHNFPYTFIRFWGRKKNFILSLYNFIHPLFATLVHSTPLLLLSLFSPVSPHIIFSPLHPLPSYFIIHLTSFYIAPLRHRLLRIVLRCLEYCPRAGLLNATTLSRFWNSAATNAWLGLALAAFCAFYLCFAKPR